MEKLKNIILQYISNYRGTGKELKDDLEMLIEEIQIMIEGISDK